MSFAEKIKYARNALQLSQEKLAVKLGVSFATINRLEKGHAMPSYATQEKFLLFCRDQGIVFKD